MSYELVIALPDHCAELAPRLRRADALEIRDMSDMDSLTALHTSLDVSVCAWTWLVDGVPALMTGVAAPSIVGNVGYPWLMTTDLVRSHVREFWRGSQNVLSTIRARYPRLEGLCDARYETSLRWLRRLGFFVEHPVKIEPFRTLVCRYWIG